MPKIDWKWFDSPTHVALFLGGLLIAAGSTIAYLVLVPAETRADFQPWIRDLLVVLMSGGGATSVAALVAGRASSREPQRVASAEATATPSQRPTRLDGFANLNGLLLAIAVGSAVLLISGVLHGCSPSDIRVHATLASLGGATVDDGCELVQHQRDVEQHTALEANDTREAAAAAVQATRLRWDPYVFGCNLAADAQNAWAEFLTLSTATGGFQLSRSIGLAAIFVHAYDDFVALRPPLPNGIVLPTIPAELLALIATPVPSGGAQ